MSLDNIQISLNTDKYQDYIQSYNQIIPQENYWYRNNVIKDSVLMMILISSIGLIGLFFFAIPEYNTKIKITPNLYVIFFFGISFSLMFVFSSASFLLLCLDTIKQTKNLGSSLININKALSS